MEAIIELLSNTEQTEIIMQNIASYVVYIYPGIISIYLYNFFVARTTKDTQAFVIKSFAISYIYNLFLDTAYSTLCFLRGNTDKNSIVYNMVLISIAFFTPYFCYKIKMSKVFAVICDLMGICTSTTDVPFDLLEDEEEKYTCLKIYLKDDPYAYIGYLGEYEYEDGHEKYIILTGYKKYFINSKCREKLIVGYNAEDYNEKVFVRFNDIKLIEKIGENRAKEEIYNKK